MHKVLVNRLGGLSLPRKSVVRLTDRPDMTLDVYRGCKTTMQHRHKASKFYYWIICSCAESILDAEFLPLMPCITCFEKYEVCQNMLLCSFMLKSAFNQMFMLSDLKLDKINEMCNTYIFCFK